MIAPGRMASASARAGRAARRAALEQAAGALPGHGRDDEVELAPRAVGEQHCGGGAAVAVDLADGRAAMNGDAVIGQPRPQAAVDPLLQRHARQQQRAGFARRQQTVDEGLADGGERGPLGRLAHGAENDRRPETRDRPRRLPLAAKPHPGGHFGHALGRSQARQPQQRPEGPPALAGREVLLGQQGGQQVQRGRQPAGGGEVAADAVGAEEVKRGVSLEALGQARAAAEVQEVGTAAQGQVLAGIDELPARPIAERGGAAAQRGGLLEQFHLAAVLGGGGRGAESGQSAADDSDAGGISRGDGSHCGIPDTRFSCPLKPTGCDRWEKCGGCRRHSHRTQPVGLGCVSFGGYGRPSHRTQPVGLGCVVFGGWGVSATSARRPAGAARPNGRQAATSSCG